MDTATKGIETLLRRGLVVAVPALLVAGLIGVGVVNERERGVTAASTGLPGDAGAVASPLPVNVPVPPEVSLPEAATSTTEAPVSTTTLPRPTTTAPTVPEPQTSATTAPPASSSGVPTNAFVVTIASEFDATVKVTINGLPFEVAPGRQLSPVTIEAVEYGNDSLGMWRADAPSCGLGDAGGLFQPGKRFRLTVIAADGSGCGGPASGLKAPHFRIAPA